MGCPLAFRHRHICEGGLKRGVLRAAGVNTEADRPRALQQMANPHLAELHTVCGALYAVIVLPAAEPVPHGLDGSVNSRSSPIGVAVIGNDAAQVLEMFVFVLNRGFQSVFTVQIQNDTALVKTALALEFCFHSE